MRITDVLTGVSILLWLGVIGTIVLVFLQSSRGQQVKNSRNIIIGVVAVAIVLTTISAGLVFIEPALDYAFCGKDCYLSNIQTDLYNVSDPL
jgi:hypothetical protein